MNAMGYFNMTYYDSLMHSGTKKRDLNGTSISSEKGTDNKANNTSAYNHDYYMHHKDKWQDNDKKSKATKDISDFTGMKDEAIKKLQELAESKGMDSKEYKDLLSSLAEGDNDRAKKISEMIKNSASSSDKEFDLDAAALDVIRGKYGNGQARKDALGEDYAMVQKRVNEMYKEGKFGGGGGVSLAGDSGGSSSAPAGDSAPATGNAWYNNYTTKIADKKADNARKAEDKQRAAEAAAAAKKEAEEKAAKKAAKKKKS